MRPPATSIALAIAALLVGALAGACAGDEAGAGAGDPAPKRDARGADQRAAADRNVALPAPFHCPADGSNCATARGRIIYVEAVDPDGDGDAHFVLASEESVTAQGITVVDVRVDLRPDPLPKAGDTLSAIGPVYVGSYGQRQIEATAIRVRRDR